MREILNYEKLSNEELCEKYLKLENELEELEYSSLKQKILNISVMIFFIIIGLLLSFSIFKAMQNYLYTILFAITYLYFVIICMKHLDFRLQEIQVDILNNLLEKNKIYKITGRII